jgi:hypothetical protein
LSLVIDARLTEFTSQVSLRISEQRSYFEIDHLNLFQTLAQSLDFIFARLGQGAYFLSDTAARQNRTISLTFSRRQTLTRYGGGFLR